MFSGLASYFLTAQSEPATVDDINYQTLEAEDDWLLVDFPGASIGKRPPSPLPEEAHMMRDLAPVLVGVMESSHGCSLPELTPPASPMDGSWFVTPPPCFMARQPVHLETSPLENLLIEHPSMSVYGPYARSHAATARPTPKHSAATKKAIQASTVKTGPTETTSSPDVPSSNATDVLTARRPHPGPRPSAVAARAGWLEQLHGVRPAQRAQACWEQHSLRHNQIDRQNRVMQEGNRRPKRRDRMAARCSRVNNNRKCC